MDVTEVEAVSKEKAPRLLEPVIAALTPKELAELLVKANDIHEGLYDLSIEFSIGIGAVGPNSQSLLPGALVGVSKFGLVRSSVESPLSVDASIVNPPVKKARKRRE